jgi:hypothetical protein
MAGETDKRQLPTAALHVLFVEQGQTIRSTVKGVGSVSFLSLYFLLQVHKSLLVAINVKTFSVLKHCRLAMGFGLRGFPFPG